MLIRTILALFLHVSVFSPLMAESEPIACEMGIDEDEEQEEVA